jgi:glycosyltransferase involved in cell wall biosynthesis
MYLVLPSRKISGGVIEAIKFAKVYREKTGDDITVVQLWGGGDEVALPEEFGLIKCTNLRPVRATAALTFPLATLRLFKSVFEGKKILTHYTTFPAGLLFPDPDDVIFVQGLEHEFHSNRLVRWCVKFANCYLWGRCNVVTTNNFLREYVLSHSAAKRVQVYGLWADPLFRTPESTISVPRRYDYMMIVRKGSVKRPDLYREMLSLLSEVNASSCVVTVDEDLAAEMRGFQVDTVIKASRKDLCALYRQSRFFILLSDFEGFALPPLEAMGCGCIPIVRDCGGVHSYLTGELAELIVPRTFTASQIYRKSQMIDEGGQYNKVQRLCRSAYDEGLKVSQEQRESLRFPVRNTSVL